MLKDFRETLYTELQSDKAQSEFIQAYFEQDGIPGIRHALQCVADAERCAKTGVLTPETPRGANRAVRQGNRKRIPHDADVLRRKLLRHGLDFALTPTQAVPWQRFSRAIPRARGGRTGRGCASSYLPSADPLFAFQA